MISFVDKPSIKVGTEWVQKGSTCQNAANSVAGIARAIYERTFRWVSENPGDEGGKTFGIIFFLDNIHPWSTSPPKDDILLLLPTWPSSDQDCTLCGKF